MPANATATDPWGVTDGYEDTLGVWRETSDAARAAIHAAMVTPPPSCPRTWVIRAGRRGRLRGPAEIALEDGAVVRAESALPADLPFGYHTLRALHPTAGEPECQRLVVVPAACHLPARLRVWGWAAQLYAARSRESWGIGDLGDLRRLARWSRARGASVLLVNPLHATMPIVPQQPSPYLPITRRYRNPLLLRIEDIPGAAALGAELEPLATAGRALNAGRRIDRDRIFPLKMDALERLWRRFPGDPAFDRWGAAEGRALDDFAVFCVLAETHRSGWRAWPAEYRRPDAPAVGRFAAEHADRVAFHRWLQWLLDAQLARAAGEGVALMQDLPIGVDRDGADAWAWQDLLAADVSVGAPPDRYNAHGQDWGLPPFVPHRLRDAGYEPFVQTIRATLRHAGGLRIDHALGLFRLFWVPRGLRPADGAYVRYPADDLLGIVALESHRARAFVVGEDLGTVEHGVRERLARQRVLSYRVLWFEEAPPVRWPRLALAAVTTHDLPTIAGLWSGADARAQAAMGLKPDEVALARIRRRLADLTGVPLDAPAADVVVPAHRALARAPSAIVTATLDDALAVEERPNVPATVDERPNWSLALPVPLEELERSPLPLAVADALARARPRRDARAREEETIP